MDEEFSLMFMKTIEGCVATCLDFVTVFQCFYCDCNFLSVDLKHIIGQYFLVIVLSVAE